MIEILTISLFVAAGLSPIYIASLWPAVCPQLFMRIGEALFIVLSAQRCTSLPSGAADLDPSP